jgi:vacuolar-type H+-ATPase subunit H
LHEHEPGDSVTITVVRDGRERSFDVELGERPGLRMLNLGDHDFSVIAPDVRILGCDEDEEDCEHSFSWSCAGDDCEGFTFDLGRLSRFGARPLLGVQLVHVTDELREHLGGREGNGVLVSKVLEGTPAEDAGIEVGDLIVSVDGEEVEDHGDISEALEGKAGEKFDVEVIRDGRPVSILVTIPELDDDRPTGPRALIELRGLERHVDEALEQARDAMRQSRSAFNQALRQSHSARRDAMADARKAYREALRESREARRDSAREIREAIRKNLDRRNSI